jgi:hypothetical protein
MCSGISSVPKMSSGSRLKLKSKKNESQDCNQDQEKQMRRRDYSKMVLSFDGRLFSLHGVSPCPPWLWGFLLEEEDEREWNDGSVYEWICRAPEGFLFAVEVHREWWLAGAHWWEYQTTRVFSLDVKGFFQWNSVHDSRIRILCGFCAKGQKFVRIRLEESSRNRSKQWRFIC